MPSKTVAKMLQFRLPKQRVIVLVTAPIAPVFTVLFMLTTRLMSINGVVGSTSTCPVLLLCSRTEGRVVPVIVRTLALRLSSYPPSVVGLVMPPKIIRFSTVCLVVGVAKLLSKVV